MVKFDVGLELLTGKAALCIAASGLFSFLDLIASKKLKSKFTLTWCPSRDKKATVCLLVSEEDQ